MNTPILVTYASRAGSTAETAEAIGRTLTQNGLTVHVLPMQEVKDLSRYSAVVAGSAIQRSQWLPEALKFVQTHRSELARKPFATFTVCITLAMSNGEQYRSAVREWIAPVRALARPVSEGLCPGVVRAVHGLPFGMRLAVALGIFPKDDRRDWKAVEAWAAGLKLLLVR